MAYFACFCTVIWQKTYFALKGMDLGIIPVLGINAQAL
jgi:hypothetical protein